MMTARDFCYWLQGYFELSNEPTITGEQRECIRRHLALVFVHDIDPKAGPPAVQAVLNSVHNGPSIPPEPPEPYVRPRPTDPNAPRPRC